MQEGFAVQTIVVGVLIVLAGAYVARSLVRAVSPQCGGCGHGCGSCKAEPVAATVPGRIPLEML